MTAFLNIFVWFAKKPRLSWIVIALIVAPAAVGVSFLSITTDQTVFFGQENPEYLSYRKLEQTFGPDDSIIFVLGSKSETIFTKQNLESIQQLTNAAWEVPSAMRVNSLSNYQYSYSNGDEIIIEDLILDAALLSAEYIDRTRSIALLDPIIRNLFVSEDARTAAIFVSVEYSPENPEAIPSIMSEARKLVEEFESENSDLEIALTGSAPLSNAFQEATLRDGIKLYPIAVVTVFLGFLLLWRSLGAALSPIILVFAATAFTMGLGGWLGYPVTPIFVGVPILLLTIGVAGIVHLNHSFSTYLVHQAPEDAVISSLKHNFKPIILTTASTAIGFYSFLFADSPPLRQFGLLAATGVLVTMVLVLLGHNSLLKYFAKNFRKSAGPSGFWRFLHVIISKHPAKMLFSGILLSIAVCLYGLPRIVLDDRFDNYFNEEFEVRRDIDFARDRLIGVFAIEFVFSSGEENGIFDPEFLKSVDDFVVWLENEETVTHVSSMSHLLKRLNKNIHNDDPAYYSLPETREEAAQYFLLYELTLPLGQDLKSVVNIDRSAIRITAATPNASAVDLRNLKKQGEDRASRYRTEIDITGTGTGVMFAHISIRNIEGMFRATLGVIAIIFVIFAWAFRSVKISVAGLLANLLPLIVSFAVWGLLFQNIGMASSIIAALGLGLIVDDTVHLVSRYMEKRGGADAMLYAFETAGPAIVQTSVILFVGFGVLALSGFVINSTIGLLMMLIIVSALIVDLLVLPALLMTMNGKSFGGAR